MDGDSSDETATIVKQYPHATFHSEPDKGLYDAMNKGIAKASGDIIGILNSDDFYAHQGVLAKIVEQFTDPNIDAVYGDLDYIDPIHTHKVIRKWRSGGLKSYSFLLGWMPPHPTFFVRKELYEKYGTFNLSFKTSSDYELMLRFLYKNKVQAAYFPEVLVKMRAGGVSNSSFKHRLQANKEDRQAWLVNQLKPYIFTHWLKPLRKLSQWI